MSDERLIDRIVTKFLLDTCRPRELQLLDADSEIFFAAALCKAISSFRPLDDAEASSIPLITGSVAEFYIEPMLPHLGDIDVMGHLNDQLAIPRGHPPPTQLPAEFHDYVYVFEIIDSHLPGYVYLVSRYLLTECSDDGNYKAVEYDMQLYLRNTADIEDVDVVSHGPALIYRSVTRVSKDIVSCVRCLVWLPQAADWPTRHRNHGWPDSATLDCVVSNGCDVVGVAHRQCRQHKWMGKYQRRLSFSRAEIVLINSWMPVQQIVYHMLRYFAKTERLTDRADNSGADTLSNYHIKTLMLWACELKSTSWWIGDLNLIRVCVKLLHTLAVWMADERCSNYFINNCNLIDNAYDVQTVSNQLMSINESWLSTWYINKYIRRCSQLCASHVSRMMDDVTTSVKLQNAVTAIVAWKENNALIRKRRAFNLAQLGIQLFFREVYSLHCLDAWSYVYFMKELSKFDSRLVIYSKSVVLLHIAEILSESDLSDEIVDTLATVLGHFLDIRRKSNRRGSRQLLFKAIKLMKVVSNKSLSTMSLIEIELSKAYLYRALRCKDSDSDSIYCLTNVYLAVLYYTAEHYQTAIDHCKLVTRSQDHSQYSSHVVQGEILPKVDDHIHNVLGLIVFYQYFRSAVLNRQQTQCVSVFTTELFAYNLDISCQRFIETPSTDDVHRREKYYNGKKKHLIADVLALKYNEHLLAHSYQHNVVKRSSNVRTTELAELLEKFAIEHLTIFREIEARDFGSIAPIVITDFEALYAYKHGDYQRCLQLSTQNVHTLLYGVLSASGEADEFIMRGFIYFLMDDDIVALTALTLLVNLRCRKVRELNCISQLTLALYLTTQCQLKLRHSMASLSQSLDYIGVVQRMIYDWRTLDHLTLKLTERKALMYITDW